MCPMHAPFSFHSTANRPSSRSMVNSRSWRCRYMPIVKSGGSVLGQAWVARSLRSARKTGTSSSRSSRRITSLPSSGIVASLPFASQHVEPHPVERLAPAQPGPARRAGLHEAEPPGELASRLVPARAAARDGPRRQCVERELDEQVRALRPVALPPVLRVDHHVQRRGKRLPPPVQAGVAEQGAVSLRRHGQIQRAPAAARLLYQGPHLTGGNR